MNENVKAEKAPRSVRSDIYDWLQCIVMAIVICVLFFSFIVRLVDVVGSSMYPTLENGDKILVSNLFYTPKQGDIVVFRKDEYREEPLVKRIIAVEGQTVDIDFERGIVYVDGEPLDEPYIASPPRTLRTSSAPWRCPRAASSSWATTATPPPTAVPRR